MPKIERRNSFRTLGPVRLYLTMRLARNRKNGKLPIRLNTIPLRATTGYGNGKAQGSDKTSIPLPTEVNGTLADTANSDTTGKALPTKEGRAFKS